MGLHWSGGWMTGGRATGETMNDGTSVGSVGEPKWKCG